MTNEERGRSSMFFQPTRKDHIHQNKTAEKQEQRRGKKEGKSSSHSSDSTPLPLHKANEEKEILETGNKEKRENNV